METRTIARDEIANLKFAIVTEQSRLADLGRLGEKAKARSLRDRLYQKLNRLEILEALAAQSELQE